MGVSPSNNIYPSPASYTRLSTQMSIDSYTEPHQQHVTSIYKVQVTPTGATPMCCGSTRSDDTVMFQAHRQSSRNSSKTITDSLMRTAKGAAYTFNSVSSDPTRGRSARELSATLQMDSLRTVKGSYSKSIEHTHGQNIPYPSTTLQMDSLRTGKETYSTSLEITHGQNTPDRSTTVQMDSLRTVKETYGTSTEIAQGQNVRDPSATLQMDSLRTVKGTYSAYVDQTHGQNTLDPSSTLQIDSLRTVKGTYGAYIDQTREQSTRSLSKSPRMDSLIIRTAKGSTEYGVSTVQGSFVAVEQSEKASNFQGQSQVSSFQVQPSFSSLSPTISPSHTGK